MANINLKRITLDNKDSCVSSSDLLESKTLANYVIAFGVFDGFHIGHKHLIETTIHQSKLYSTNSAVLTFDIDPDELFNKNSLIKISENYERIKRLANSGIDDVFILQFTNFVANLNPIEFLSMLFDDKLPQAIVVGENFKFGRNASGDVETLKKWAFDRGVEVVVVPLVQSNGKPVSSTRIRNLIAKNDLFNANKLLGK